jgi:hypothetical protein
VIILVFNIAENTSLPVYKYKTFGNEHTRFNMRTIFIYWAFGLEFITENGM